MSSIICPNCRLNVSPGEAWCHHCGVRLPVQPGSDPSADYPGSAPHGAAGFPAIPEYGLPRDAGGLSVHWGFGQEGGGVWRDGNTVVMHKTARLPDYCIKCGVEANGSHLRKKLRWHHPALVLLILAGFLIYLIVALIVRKSATVDLSLCADHMRKHRTALIATWLMFLIGLAFMVLAIGAESGGSAGFGLLLLFGSVISALSWARVVTVQKIDDNYVWLRSIDENFLARLPFLQRT